MVHLTFRLGGNAGDGEFLTLLYRMGCKKLVEIPIGRPPTIPTGEFNKHGISIDGGGFEELKELFFRVEIEMQTRISRFCQLDMEDFLISL